MLESAKVLRALSPLHYLTWLRGIPQLTPHDPTESRIANKKQGDVRYYKESSEHNSTIHTHKIVFESIRDYRTVSRNGVTFC